MRKIVVLFAVAVLCFDFPICANAADKVADTQIVRATKNTTITYAGLQVFVPIGQTIVLGSSSNGAISLKGQNLKGVKIGDGTISATEPIELSVQPSTQVVRILKGNGVKITDKNGRTAELSKGASISMQDIRKNVRLFSSQTVVNIAQPQPKKVVSTSEAKNLALDEDINAEIFAFVEAAEESIVTLEPKKYRKKKKKSK